MADSVSIRPKDALAGREAGSAYDSGTFKSSMTIRVEQNVGAMSISPSGRDVVLASRDGLHIIDLDSPFNPPRFLRHLSSWEVADVQWSPFAIRDYWVVSTSNQKALVWNLNCPSTNAVETVLHGHSRAITDINFSAHNPDHLATCAVDSFVHIWDMKTSRRPVLTFSDWFAGATQVKYNRQDENVIASSHDRLLHIWDKRKGAFPLHTIEAHDTKIYGIDWNRTRKTGIVTCSLDRAVKFWDYSKGYSDPERILRTSYPVWRARHTPFGWGIMAMPQRGENDLFLYDRRATGDAYAEPVTKFSYHSAPVKEFLWRSRGGTNPDRDDREFQLVTWSKDREIRLWEIPLRLMKGIGHDPEAKLRFRLTRLGARYKTFRREPPIKSNDKSHTLPRLSALTDAGQRIAPPLRVNAPSHRPVSSASRFGLSNRQHGLGKSFMSGQRTNTKSTALHRDMNPIQWMKGIKMQHRGDGVFGLGGNSDEDQKLENSSNFDLNIKPTFTFGWTGPESLSDEITLVGLRFSKIRFDKVNVNNRTCLMSFSGPWGLSSQWVFLRCSVHFPAHYPSPGANPIFQVEKTTKIMDDKLEEIYMQLKRIADSYLEHGKFCLEACLSFLLGERAEDAMYWGGKRGPGAPEDESSSDEDIGSALARGPDQGPPGLKQLIRKNNKGSVPLAKACGAMWSETGKLVCFFPPKEEQPVKSLISILNFSERLRDPFADKSSRRLFESFGRLQSSTIRNLRPVSATGVDESGDEVERSGSSDLGSSSASEELVYSVARWKERHEFRTASSRNRNDSTDRSTQAGNEGRSIQRSAGTSQLKTSHNFNKPDLPFTSTVGSRKQHQNYIAIHDYSHLLPSNRELAEDYAIYGTGTDVCKHNASIAGTWKQWDIRDTWKLAELVLCKEIPLELSSDLPGKDPMLVVSPQWRNLGSHTGTPQHPSPGKDEFYGRVKWGNHPGGGIWLVEKLISHFEKKLNPQMLAMLSCIFLEPEAKSSFTSASLHLSQKEMPISLKSPGFSLDYYPSFINALRRSDSFTLSPQHLSGTNTPLVTYPNSYSSSLGDNAGTPWVASASDPTTPYSIGGTPPTQPNLVIRGHSDLGGAQSMSSSPEHLHNHHHPYQSGQNQVKRSTGISNITGGIARALTSQGGLGAVIAGGLNGMGASPPGRKIKPPPPEQNVNFSIAATNQQSSTVSWAPEQQNRGKAKTSGWGIVTEEGDETEEEYLIDLQLHHLEHFDDEGAMSVPLLDNSRQQHFRHYRETYADMLYTWDLPLQRLEILKFNGLKAFNDINLDKLETFSRKQDKIWDGLVVGGCCPQCGSTSTNSKRPHSGCAVCKDQPTCSLQCVICNTIIKGLYTPCLFCGHIFHTECHSQWTESGNYGCPSGCGCMDCTSTPNLGCSKIL
ncbi:hypothetical protein TWF569_003344 [Orbilia oligospora]|uniref:RING-type domain-containing protein n=1 Tax=Orbilia oligospora TaxID=2813651 RepID=A0A7C8JA30_ORBOL|nr:hypothetical protein TWF706_004566 [Orbilia oligospora]KAF3079374.1 hypothetical protein TWF102_002908 [Orbilia oligospora]KAF3082806.1 hypothetical protein TWF103_003111 [Orbilia oligospora]KAF3120190.1 hypothetical protein TWF569_003344 [Orbilia oligospora]KAF3120831.1 hypothetical protein TWF594_003652 [Orbilia oligospora]